MQGALGRMLDPGVVGSRTAFPIPDWDGDPEGKLGGIDLSVRHQPDGDLRYLAELKVDDVQHTLWDLLKLASATQLRGVEAAYLLVAASMRCWDSRKACVAFFPASPTPPTRWATRELFSTYEHAWRDLLKGGSARPTRLPQTITTQFVAASAVRAYPGYELRAIAVNPIWADGAFSLSNGWPVPA